MFAVTEILQYDASLPHKKSGIFLKNKPTIYEIESPHGIFYKADFLNNRKTEKAMKKFKARCRLPIITAACPEYEQFALITLANTVCNMFTLPPEIGISDTFGSAPYLILPILKKVKCLTVYTKNPDAFYGENEKIYKKLGAKAVITGKISPLYKTDAVIAVNQISGSIHPLTFGLNSGITPGKIIVPDYYKNCLAEFKNPELALAGMRRFFNAAKLNCCRYESLKKCGGTLSAELLKQSIENGKFAAFLFA